MKKVMTCVYSIVLTAFIVALATGCDNRSSMVFTPGSPQSIEQALEFYTQTLAKMEGESYQSITDGASVVTTLGLETELKISGIYQHTTTSVYFENISNGKPMLGINTSFARRVSYSKNASGDSVYHFATSEGKKDVSESGMVVIPEADWSTAQNINEDDFKNKFGKSINSFSNYVINKDTVSDQSKGVEQRDKDGYTLQFVIDVSSGTASPGVAGYAKQIFTMSDKKCVSFDYVSVTIKIDNDFKILSCQVDESYNVDAGILNIKPNTKNKINYAFTYDKNLAVKSF